MDALVLKYGSSLEMSSRWTEEERRMPQLRPGKAGIVAASYPLETSKGERPLAEQVSVLYATTLSTPSSWSL